MDKAGLMQAMMDGGQGNGEAPQAESQEGDLLQQIFSMIKDIHDVVVGGQGGQQQQAAPPPQQ